MKAKDPKGAPRGNVTRGRAVEVGWCPGVPESYELDGAGGVVTKVEARPTGRGGMEEIAVVQITSKERSGERALPPDALIGR